jgi:fibronectin type 3 domain-containing protein
VPLVSRHVTRAGLAVAAAIAAALFTACAKEGPTDIDFTTTLPVTPADLVATVGETRVALSWDVPDTSGIGSYRVYRGASPLALSLTATVASPRYSDAGLVSGRRYYYQVSAVTRAGVEGRRSDVVEATPNVFAVEIQGGDEMTRSRQVTLSISAPGSAVWMILGNDSLFAGVAFQALSLLKDWTLADGDGTKRVFARFRDTLGVESEIRSDDIVLDTRADIRAFEVRESAAGPLLASGKAYTPGDTLFFSLDAGEIGGDAFVAIGSQVANLALRDDGQGGDRAAGNGVYELRYVIPGGLALQGAPITADFLDRAGNVAPSATAVGTLTVVAVSEPPPAVTLAAVSAVSATEATLSWTPSGAVDFASYRLYRSASPNVTQSDLLVGQPITSPGATLLVDSGLAENTTYYWRVFVGDGDGFSTPSNEVSATTVNTAPAAVTLSDAMADTGSVRLQWTRATALDFAAYRVHRSATEAVSESSQVVVTISDVAETAFVDTTVVEDATFSYRVFVVDRGGLTAGSNKRSATVANRAPAAVALSAPTLSPGGVTPTAPQNVSISWTAATEADFGRYEVVVSNLSAAPCSGSVEAVLTNPLVVAFAYPATQAGTYFFSIRVIDRGGLSACSNVVVAVVQ